MQEQQFQSTILCAQQSQYQLVSLLELSLIQPTSALQKQLKKYPCASYIPIALNQKYNTNLRLAAATAAKMIVLQTKYQTNKRIQEKQTQLIQSTYIRLYSQKNHSQISNRLFMIFQSILNAIYSITMKEQQKAQCIKQILITIKGSNIAIKQIPLKLKILSVVLSTMSAEDVNNVQFVQQICKIWTAIWTNRNQLSKQLWDNGDGVEMCLISVDCIRNIIDIAQKNQQEPNIPQKYLESKGSIQLMMLQILSIDQQGTPQANFPKNVSIQSPSKRQISIESGCIMCFARLDQVQLQKLSRLKLAILELWNDIWIFHAQQNLFVSALKTLIFSDSIGNLMDTNEQIVLECLKVIQRSTSHQAYAPVFFRHRQSIIICLLNLIRSRQSEVQMITMNPEQFVDMEQDFCLKQQHETMKTRAGSLISTLCLSVDSYMTMTFNICMLSIQSNIGTPIQYQHLNNMWKIGSDQRIETSLIVLACISDQIQKRKDLDMITRSFLYTKQKQLQGKLEGQYLVQIKTHIPLILRLCRLITLYGFYSYPTCLNAFLPLLSVHPVFFHQLQFAFRTIIHYKKNQDSMKQYINCLVRCILLQTNDLNALLQNTIISKYQLIAPVQTQVLQKLAVWFLAAYDERNMQRCNRLNMLINAVVHKYVVANEQQLIAVQVLAKFLHPLYRALLNSNCHPAQSCIIDISIVHVQKIGLLSFKLKGQQSQINAKQEINKQKPFTIKKDPDSMSQITQHVNRALSLGKEQIKNLWDIWQLAKLVVNRNNGMLNNCLQLLVTIIKIQSHFCTQMIPDVINWMIEVSKTQGNQKYTWQLATLLQILILNAKQVEKQAEMFNFLKNAIESSRDSHLIARKLLSCTMALFYVSNNAHNYLHPFNGMALPQKWAPPQLKPFCIYLIRFCELFSNQQYVGYLFQTLVRLIHQLENPKLKENFEDVLYDRHSDSDGQIQCYHRGIKFLKMHPLVQADIYERLRSFWVARGEKLKSNNILSNQALNFVRDLLLKKVVNNKCRKVYKVNKTRMNQILNKQQDSKIEDENIIKEQ